jgi:hypothetical protein
MTVWSGLWGRTSLPSSTRLPIEALNDPQIKNHHENLGLRMPPADQWSPEALDALAEGGNRQGVADDQGRQRQGGLTTPQVAVKAADAKSVQFS